MTILLVALSLNFTLFKGRVADSKPAADSGQARQVSGAFLTGENGRYTGEILVNTSADTAWKVLTDYENFPRFMPTVIDSQLLTTQGNQKVFELVYQIRAIIVDKRIRVRIANVETYPQQIAFKLVEGDLRSLQGTWTIQPISSRQVRIQHQVAVDPGSTPSRAIFYNIYESSLKNTLEAIKKEAEGRN
ncbi:SRPBCC family protein [Lyngbya sp. CCY1209]|uniref:SRPBCC family protein n=1 Tax=Lyngbya sp. CCY1209 TaxID=2886103 RepID=UPI002D202867|nr:SRPBCC family protein [Lyngbya sp. CCY1209]MEB3883032.1 SRPBCC family protein [Lyngbya sp. CCY1209]